MDAPPEIPSSHRSERHVTRRTVLLTSAVALATGAGVGVSYQALRGLALSGTGTVSAPVELLAALDAERALLALVDAAIAGATASAAAPALNGIRADHLAHAAALRVAVDSYSAGPAPTSPATTVPPVGAAASRAHLRAAELAASTAAVGRAAQLAGREAALLASIAACEATHAQVLG